MWSSIWHWLTSRRTEPLTTRRRPMAEQLEDRTVPSGVSEAVTPAVSAPGLQPAGAAQESTNVVPMPITITLPWIGSPDPQDMLRVVPIRPDLKATVLGYSRAPDRTGSTTGPLPTNWPFGLDAGVANVGHQTADHVSLGYFASQDAVIDPRVDLFLGRSEVGTLAPGETWSGFHPFTLPYLKLVDRAGRPLVGRVYLGVVADFEQTIPEADETNNSAQAATTLYDPVPARARHHLGRSDPGGGYLSARSWMIASGFEAAEAPLRYRGVRLEIDRNWVMPVPRHLLVNSPYDGADRPGTYYHLEGRLARRSDHWEAVIDQFWRPKPVNGDAAWLAYVRDWSRRFG